MKKKTVGKVKASEVLEEIQGGVSLEDWRIGSWDVWKGEESFERLWRKCAGNGIMAA